MSEDDKGLADLIDDVRIANLEADEAARCLGVAQERLDAAQERYRRLADSLLGVTLGSLAYVRDERNVSPEPSA